jgi:hypothetical protein
MRNAGYILIYSSAFYRTPAPGGPLRSVSVTLFERDLPSKPGFRYIKKAKIAGGR